MDDIVVSFCIAAFQRYEILKQLLLEILSVDSDKFEVIVCDNHSEDGSIEKIKALHDPRMKIYVNDKNIGALPNMYQSIEHGRGRYLFYVNDRDNVDPFKIKKLISVLEILEKKDVAFIKCEFHIPSTDSDYQLFSAGEEALLNFGCKIDHPTGYLFRRDAWLEIKNRKEFFEKECYGDFTPTIICAVMALKYNGAWIFGDICDRMRERLDFTKEKSRFYQGRKDKRVWYSPEVQWRELMIAYNFLKKMCVEEKTIDKLLAIRYKEYLAIITICYKDIISKPVHTSHYDLHIPQNTFYIHMKVLSNSMYLWRRMKGFCQKNQKMELLKVIKTETESNFKLYLNNVSCSMRKALTDKIGE